MRFRDWRRMSEQAKTLVPKLRFPRFINDKAWDSKKLEDLIETVTPPQKLQTSQYQIAGEYPIFDQSQSYICGWTDNKESLVTDNLPLIIFGDHTCALKIADKPFAQGADGIKILKTKNELETQFLYQSLQNKPLIMEEYKRHFSTLKERIVFYPDIVTGEQQKIADCLSSLDDLITAQNQKVEALKQHKKGLMQQLFPAKGKTVPKLRFPEFENDGEWKPKALSEIVNPAVREVNKPEANYLALGIRSHGKGTFQKPDQAPEKNSMDKLYLVNQDDLIVNITFAWEGAIAIAKENDHGTYVSHRFPTYTFNEKVSSSSFFQYVIINKSFIYKLGLISPGGAGRNRVMNKSDFLKLTVLLPSTDEQKKIAHCLSSLDNCIDIQMHKLDALKEHKKGLMQQLFPSTSEVEK